MVRGNAGDDVGERAPFGGVVAHVVGRHEGRARGIGHDGQAGEPAGIVAAVKMAGGEIIF